MTNIEFEKILKDTIDNIEISLSVKAKEYAKSEDKLYNFKRSALITGETESQVCVGFMVKHLTSILDIVENDYIVPGAKVKKEVLDEKFGDAINYLILLKAILLEGRTQIKEK